MMEGRERGRERGRKGGREGGRNQTSRNIYESYYISYTYFSRTFNKLKQRITLTRYFIYFHYGPFRLIHKR